jgi:UDP-glucose 4-epimerase
MQKQQSKVVVTGHCGFIGSHLYKKLEQDGYTVVGVDIRDPESPLDIRDHKQMLEVTRGADVIFHFAAISSSEECEKDPIGATNTNVEGTRVILEAAKINGARVIFASSASIYGEQWHACAEYMVPNPIGTYATTKLKGEELVREYLSQGVIGCSLRLFNVYGKGCRGVVDKFIKFAETYDEVLEVSGTGQQTRDFIYIDDVTRVIIDAYIRTFSPQFPLILNVGTGQETSIFCLARVVAGLYGSDPTVFDSDLPTGVPRSIADVSLLRTVTNVVPRNIVMGLSEMF